MKMQIEIDGIPHATVDRGDLYYFHLDRWAAKPWKTEEVDSLYIDMWNGLPVGVEMISGPPDWKKVMAWLNRQMEKANAMPHDRERIFKQFCAIKSYTEKLQETA